MFGLCVFCGSKPGGSPVYADAARRLGRSIGERGWRLVYGGGRAGLMGEVADAALAAGAQVVGVIPDSLMRLEVGHPGLTEIHVVRTMHQRKTMMAERADAFVALPGGIGTLEELFEVWSWRHLAYHTRPIGLLEVDAYWQPMLEFLERTRREGFVSEAQLDMLQVDYDIDRLLDTLTSAAPKPADFGRI